MLKYKPLIQQVGSQLCVQPSVIAGRWKNQTSQNNLFFISLLAFLFFHLLQKHIGASAIV